MLDARMSCSAGAERGTTKERERESEGGRDGRKGDGGELPANVAVLLSGLSLCPSSRTVCMRGGRKCGGAKRGKASAPFDAKQVDSRAAPVAYDLLSAPTSVPLLFPPPPPPPLPLSLFPLSPLPLRTCPPFGIQTKWKVFAVCRWGPCEKGGFLFVCRRCKHTHHACAYFSNSRQPIQQTLSTASVETPRIVPHRITSHRIPSKLTVASNCTPAPSIHPTLKPAPSPPPPPSPHTLPPSLPHHLHLHLYLCLCLCLYLHLHCLHLLRYSSTATSSLACV